jgi:hypothetical protein
VRSCAGGEVLAVKVGPCGLCCSVDAAAIEKPKDDCKALREARRKVEENSLNASADSGGEKERGGRTI